jgi:hypothetical protein
LVQRCSVPQVCGPTAYIYTTLMSHSAHFKRVVCPAELSQKSGCARNDDKVLSGEVSVANSLSSASSTASIFAALMLGVLSI